MSPGWKDYQKQLARESFIKRNLRIPHLKLIAFSFLALLLPLTLIWSLTSSTEKDKDSREENSLGKNIYKIALSALKPNDINSQNIFKRVKSPLENLTYHVKLSLDERLQTRMEKLLERYRPPYACAVAMDPTTGKILAMASYSRIDSSETNWCLKSPFLAASIFKLVSSAAAIERLKMTDYSSIRFNGRLYKLKRRNIFDTRKRKRNKMTLGDAFAKSVNIVFAKLVPQGLDADDFRHYSIKFFFNLPIPFDLYVEPSKAKIPEDDYLLAVTAAGFGDINLSPLHAAIIVSAILNDGKVVVPYVLEKVYNSEKVLVHKRDPQFLGNLAEPSTTKTIKRMMRLTLSRGTARKTFRRWYRDRVLSRLYIGGKTGSLSSKSLKGQHDWFVGYAEEEGGDKKVVFSAVIVNYALWHIKPAYLAKEAFKTYFR